MTNIKIASTGLSAVLVAVALTSPAVARAPVVPSLAPHLEMGHNVVPAANKLQKTLKGLKNTFKKGSKAVPPGPSRQPSSNQLPGNNIGAPIAPKRAPSQAAKGAENPYGSIPPARPAGNYYVVGPPQFPNGPYANIPGGPNNLRPAGNGVYGNANAGVNGPYGSIPPARPAGNYDVVGPPQFPNGPYANIPGGPNNLRPAGNGVYGNANAGVNGPYGSIPPARPAGNYDVVGPPQFPNGPYANIPGGPSNLRPAGNGVYEKFDASLFKSGTNGLPAQIRRLPTQRLDVVAPGNSPSQIKQLDALKTIDSADARDSKIIKGAAAGIAGSTLLLGGLGTTAIIMNMTDSPEGNE